MENLIWRTHTKNLLDEIRKSNPTVAVLDKPISILWETLRLVGKRAAELNDPELNALMCRLAIYTVSDPESPDYNEELVQQILNFKEAG